MKDIDFKPLMNVYAAMDQEWDSVARQYPFHCNGCEDNCCRSLFYHHTHVEKAFLLHGFYKLEADRRMTMLESAKTYCNQTFTEGSPAQSLKLMCPVNEKGQCLLYPYRPMICRLHGLPHELNRPGYESQRQPGCDAGRFDKMPYVQFDRTPIYQQMAQVEMAFRQAKQLTGKIRLTVADILLSDQAAPPQ